MSMQTVLTVDAVFDGAVLRPVEALPFQANDRVTLRIDVPKRSAEWPDDTEEIYREMAEEDRALANAMFNDVRKTWPKDDG